MKKIIMSLMIMFCLSLIGTGVFALSGCTTAASTSGGGNSSFDEIETPPEDDQTEEDETPEEPPAETMEENNNVTIRTYVIHGKDSTVNTINNNPPSGVTWPYFHVNCHDSSGGLRSWGTGGSATVTAPKGQTAEKTDYTALYLAKIYWKQYYLLGGVSRYLEVRALTDGSYAFCGPSMTASETTTCRSEVSYQTFYIYSGTYTTSESTAKSNCTKWMDSGQSSMADWCLYFRRKYTLSFDAQSGSSVSDVTMLAGVSYTATQTSTRTGYTFQGWSASSTATAGNKSFTIATPSANWKLYAVWKANRYQITLSNTFPGTAGTTTAHSPTSVWAEYDSWNVYAGSTGSDKPTWKAPTCTGYTFRGWADSSNTIMIESTGNAYFKWTSTSGTTYYGQWSANTYTISFDTNGGSTAPSSVTATYYKNTTWSINTPTKSNYTFAGWTTSKGGSTVLINTSGKLMSNISGYTDSSGRWISTSGTTVYAKWTPNTYTISMCKNIPTSDVETVWDTMYLVYGEGYKHTTSGSYITSLTISVSRSSYTFDGAWTATSGGTQIINSSGSIVGSKTQFTENKKIYAHWAPRYSTIKVGMYVSEYGANYASSANGGSVSVSYYTNSNNTPTSTSATLTTASGSYSAMINYALKVTATAKTGYHFVGLMYGTGTATAPTGVNTTMTSTSATYSNTFTTETNLWIYACFKKDYEIYKSGSAYYVDYGYAPQKEVTKSSAWTAVQQNFTYFGLSSCSIYSQNGNFYLEYMAHCYQFLPIKWRLVPSGTSTNYTTTGTITLVSDNVLFGGLANSAEMTYGGSWSGTNLYGWVKSLNDLKTIGSLTTQFDAGTVSQSNDTFAANSSANKVTTANATLSKLRVASVSEIETIYGSSSANRVSACTDFAAALIGETSGLSVDYWTRNLGTYRNEAKIVDSHGNVRSLKMQNKAGVRLAFTLSSATFFGRTV